jgi:hypothetical protein
MIIYLFSLLSPTHEIAAYLDPGSGSFLLQLLIGGIVGGLLILKTFWGRLRLFFLNLMGKTPVAVEETDEDTP